MGNAVIPKWYRFRSRSRSRFYLTIRTGRIQTSFLIRRHTFNHVLFSDTYVQVDNNIILGQYKRDSKYDGEY